MKIIDISSIKIEGQKDGHWKQYRIHLISKHKIICSFWLFNSKWWFLNDGKISRLLTGTAHNGTVLSFKGYLRSVIMSFPTKRWNGWIQFKTIIITASNIRINQSCIWFLANTIPWDLTVWVANRPSLILLCKYMQKNKKHIKESKVHITDN